MRFLDNSEVCLCVFLTLVFVVQAGSQILGQKCYISFPSAPALLREFSALFLEKLLRCAITEERTSRQNLRAVE